MVGATFLRHVNRNPPDLPLKLQMRGNKRKGIRGGGTSLRSVVGTADSRSVAALPHPPLRSGPLLRSLALSCPTNAARRWGAPGAIAARVAPVPDARCRGPRTETPVTLSQASLSKAAEPVQTPRGSWRQVLCGAAVRHRSAAADPGVVAESFHAPQPPPTPTIDRHLRFQMAVSKYPSKEVLRPWHATVVSAGAKSAKNP